MKPQILDGLPDVRLESTAVALDSMKSNLLRYLAGAEIQKARVDPDQRSREVSYSTVVN